MKAAEGVSGRCGSRRELEVFRPDQKGQATARIYQLPQIHTAEKTNSGSGRSLSHCDK